MDQARSPLRPLRSRVVSPGSPSLSPRKILVVVTVDAERYTPVDLTDALDRGAVIRSRILNKLGIWDDEDQERAHIFETEIGSMHIGLALNDEQLAALCRERGDSRASLAFIVDRGPPPPSRPSNLQTPPHSADSISNYSANDMSRQQRQRNRLQLINEQNGYRPDGVRSPPHRTTRPTDIFTESSPGGTDSSPQPRRVRPLPAIPTPTTTPNSGNSMATAPFDWLRGELIGGNGTDSHVYMALDRGGQIMAVKQKEIPRGPASPLGRRSLADQLRSESELLRTLDHKNIVKHIYFEETETAVNIFMEYVPGGTLRGILDSVGPFPDNVTRFLTGQILDGLAYLHSHHILHRDLRAESVLVQQDGTCKISDFAVHKTLNYEGLAFTALQGSTFWMAPEVITTKIHGGGYTNKVDIWSLGCLVLEMWSNGGRPWTGFDPSKVMKRLSDLLPPPLPEGHKLGPSARDFYDRCFTGNPLVRPSALELREHPYLLLPTGWMFCLPPKKSAPIPPRPTMPMPVAGPSKVVDNDPPQFTLDGPRRYSSKPAGLQPAEWLEINRVDLIEYIRQSKFDSLALSECADWVNSGGSLLFPRLTLFSYEAVFNLEELRAAVRAWKKWDTLTALVHYKDVNHKLRSFYEDMDQVDGLKNIVALDVDAICARLYSVVKTAEQYRRLIGLRGDEAQSMLDLLQMLLDLQTLDTTFRSPFLNALLKLSKESGLHPSPLLQRQVTLEGSYAIAAGQFGDVWKGTFQNQQVAVKVLKLYLKSDQAKHLKDWARITMDEERQLARFFAARFQRGSCIPGIVPNTHVDELISDTVL
ncbi:hypothetical protein DXG01_004472 [Tephrocybe rancida]|nr:hypothetical protein DXG01_004472 [Tephrocybe rancida]